MAKTWFIGESLEAFPENAFGDDLDLVVNEQTGEVQQRIAGVWTVLAEGDLEGSGSPVGVVTPNRIGQYYQDTSGPTYYISTGLTNNDWTQIGGSSVNYKIYRALLAQSGTSAPVATILENTLGGVPVWSRSAMGDYLLTLAGAFPAGKTLILCQADAETAQAITFNGGRLSDNQLEFSCFTNTITGGSIDISELGGSASSIQILVYP